MSRGNTPAPPPVELMVKPGRVALYGVASGRTGTPGSPTAVASPPLFRLKYVQPPTSVVPATSGNREFVTPWRDVSGVFNVVVGGGGETMMPPVPPATPAFSCSSKRTNSVMGMVALNTYSSQPAMTTAPEEPPLPVVKPSRQILYCVSNAAVEPLIQRAANA